MVALGQHHAQQRAAQLSFVNASTHTWPVVTLVLVAASLPDEACDTALTHDQHEPNQAIILIICRESAAGTCQGVASCNRMPRIR